MTDISNEKIERLANGDCTVQGEYAATLRAQAARIAELEAALIKTRAIVVEGAAQGFNYAVGDWAMRLFENNGNISRALNKEPKP